MLWLPRTLLILFALFLTIFSLDVFQPGSSAQEIAVGLALHNIPTAVLLLVVAAAWRREWLGALVCTLLGMLYIAWAWGRFPFTTYVIIAGPLFLVAALYAVNWRHRRSGG